MPIVARVRDKIKCPVHGKATIVKGYPRFLVCHRPVARKGDHTFHGGIILTGCPRVRLGRKLKAGCKLLAASGRAAFIAYTVGRPAPFLSKE